MCNEPSQNESHDARLAAESIHACFVVDALSPKEYCESICNRMMRRLPIRSGLTAAQLAVDPDFINARMRLLEAASAGYFDAALLQLCALMRAVFTFADLDLPRSRMPYMPYKRSAYTDVASPSAVPSPMECAACQNDSPLCAQPLRVLASMDAVLALAVDIAQAGWDLQVKKLPEVDVVFSRLGLTMSPSVTDRALYAAAAPAPIDVDVFNEWMPILATLRTGRGIVAQLRRLTESPDMDDISAAQEGATQAQEETSPQASIKSAQGSIKLTQASIKSAHSSARTSSKSSSARASTASALSSSSAASTLMVASIDNSIKRMVAFLFAADPAGAQDFLRQQFQVINISWLYIRCTDFLGAVQLSHGNFSGYLSLVASVLRVSRRQSQTALLLSYLADSIWRWCVYRTRDFVGAQADAQIQRDVDRLFESLAKSFDLKFYRRAATKVLSALMLLLREDVARFLAQRVRKERKKLQQFPIHRSTIFKAQDAKLRFLTGFRHVLQDYPASGMYLSEFLLAGYCISRADPDNAVARFCEVVAPEMRADLARVETAGAGVVVARAPKPSGSPRAAHLASRVAQKVRQAAPGELSGDDSKYVALTQIERSMELRLKGNMFALRVLADSREACGEMMALCASNKPIVTALRPMMRGVRKLLEIPVCADSVSQCVGHAGPVLHRAIGLVAAPGEPCVGDRAAVVRDIVRIFTYFPYATYQVHEEEGRNAQASDDADALTTDATFYASFQRAFLRDMQPVVYLLSHPEDASLAHALADFVLAFPLVIANAQRVRAVVGYLASAIVCDAVSQAAISAETSAVQRGRLVRLLAQMVRRGEVIAGRLGVECDLGATKNDGACGDPECAASASSRTPFVHPLLHYHSPSTCGALMLAYSRAMMVGAFSDDMDTVRAAWVLLRAYVRVLRSPLHDATCLPREDTALIEALVSTKLPAGRAAVRKRLRDLLTKVREPTDLLLDVWQALRRGGEPGYGEYVASLGGIVLSSHFHKAHPARQAELERSLADFMRARVDDLFNGSAAQMRQARAALCVSVHPRTAGLMLRILTDSLPAFTTAVRAGQYARCEPFLDAIRAVCQAGDRALLFTHTPLLWRLNYQCLQLLDAHNPGAVSVSARAAPGFLRLKLRLCRMQRSLLVLSTPLALWGCLKQRNVYARIAAHYLADAAKPACTSPAVQPAPGSAGAEIADLQLAITAQSAAMLRVVLDGLPLDSPDETPGAGASSSARVLFSNYFNLFVRILEATSGMVQADTSALIAGGLAAGGAGATERAGSADADSAGTSSAGSTKRAGADDALANDKASARAVSATSPAALAAPWKLHAILTDVVQALANLLTANYKIGMRDALPLCYHSYPLIRASFVKVFARIVGAGCGRIQPGEVADSGLSKEDLEAFGMAASEANEASEAGVAGVVNPGAGSAGNSAARASTTLCAALVSPPGAMLLACADVCPRSEVDAFAGAVLRLCQGCAARRLATLRLLLDADIDAVADAVQILRGNTIATRMIALYSRTAAAGYLARTLGPPLRALAEAGDLNAQVSERESSRRLLAHLRAVVDAITASVDDIPLGIRHICRAAVEATARRFPGKEHAAIGSYLFLRLYNPTIVSPERAVGVVSSTDPVFKRQAVQIARILQMLVNAGVVTKIPSLQSAQAQQELREMREEIERFMEEVARPADAEPAQDSKAQGSNSAHAQTVRAHSNSSAHSLCPHGSCHFSLDDIQPAGPAFFHLFFYDHWLEIRDRYLSMEGGDADWSGCAECACADSSGCAEGSCADSACADSQYTKQQGCALVRSVDSSLATLGVPTRLTGYRIPDSIKNDRTERGIQLYDFMSQTALADSRVCDAITVRVTREGLPLLVANLRKLARDAQLDKLMLAKRRGNRTQLSEMSDAQAPANDSFTLADRRPLDTVVYWLIQAASKYWEHPYCWLVDCTAFENVELVQPGLSIYRTLVPDRYRAACMRTCYLNVPSSFLKWLRSASQVNAGTGAGADSAGVEIASAGDDASSAGSASAGSTGADSLTGISLGSIPAMPQNKIIFLCSDDGASAMESAGLTGYRTQVAGDARVTFRDVSLYQPRSRRFIPVNLKVGARYVQMVSARPVHFLLGARKCQARTVDVYPVANLVQIAGSSFVGVFNELSMVDERTGLRLIMASPKRVEIMRTLYFSRARGGAGAQQGIDDPEPETPPEPVDPTALTVPGYLLNAALSGMLSSAQRVRNAGYALLGALTRRLRVNAGRSINYVEGLSFPGGQTEFLQSVSRNVADQRPDLAHSVLTSFFVALEHAESQSRPALVAYLSPWVSVAAAASTPADGMKWRQSHRAGACAVSACADAADTTTDSADSTADSTAETATATTAGTSFFPIVRKLIQASSMAEPPVQSAFARYVWPQISLEGRLVDVVVDESIAAALNCEAQAHGTAAAQMWPLAPTVEVCGALLRRLREKSYAILRGRPRIELHTAWVEATVIARFLARLLFDCRLFCESFLPEIMYTATIFMDAGPVDLGARCRRCWATRCTPRCPRRASPPREFPPCAR